MKKSILTLALFAFCSANALEVQEFKGFSHPESVYVDKNAVYVSNVGKELTPLNKDNDGFISKLDKDGKILELEFIKGLNAPKGMSKIGDVLYVVDIDILYGFDIKNKKEIFKLPIENAVFLNDIAVLNNDTLLVSDTGTGYIHKVFLKDKKYENFIHLDSKYGGPNGLLIDKNTLFVAGYDPSDKAGGKIISIDLNSKKIQELSKKIEQFDGIVYDKNKNLLVSSWGKNLQGYIYTLKDNKEIKLDLASIKGPADMFFDGEYLWVPKMAENALIKVKI
ncbi:ATP-binding protein [Campylobacter sp. IFREMER_LSEM_CL292]|uniref:ATP-binding protein n=1 Tax=Campylobacter sp. IFREMER_LSEM_CL292 TaxID=2911623 RepID=UPI0021E7D1BA|nr:ATP-binding protein [Campylobacter sp. IFREMER_LSEM_CL292]MCV3382743.1 ATP-binding protein [Campylobacter sp. IFREMER_LSEM_CL292]